LPCGRQQLAQEPSRRYALELQALLVKEQRAKAELQAGRFDQGLYMETSNSRALIFGISGQDGAYLADLLLSRGMEVHGTSRDIETSGFSGLNALGIFDKVKLHSVVLSNFRNVIAVLKTVRPRRAYNLAAQSSVMLSFDQPVETIDSIMHGTINVVMEAIRFLDLDTRFYNASSSECFATPTSPRPRRRRFGHVAPMRSARRPPSGR
jgi:GDPmannose 4,6-dehydratase